MSSFVSTSDWIKGIALSIVASIIGGASKLAIRKSWLIIEESSSSSSSSLNHNSSSSSSSIRIILQDNNNNNQNNINSNNDQNDDELFQRDNNNHMNHHHLNNNESNIIKTNNTDDHLRQRYHSTNNSFIESFHNERGDDDNDDEDEDEEKEDMNHNNNNNNHVHHHHHHYYLSYLLRGCGMIGMTILNPACCVMAMNYASPSILAPFSGLTLVWIVIFSQPFINEKPSRKQMIAASFIIIGQIFIAIFGDHTNDDDLSINDVMISYKHQPFVIYLILLTLWMILLIYWIRLENDNHNNNRNHNNHSNDKLIKFSWGVAGGSITGLQNFLKDSLTILKDIQQQQQQQQQQSHNNNNNNSITVVFPWYWFIMIILAAASALGGLLFLTACMKRYDATYSSAMFVGSFVISASIMSAVHYDTFSHMITIWNWIFYPFGLVILMLGIWILIQEQQQRQQLTNNGNPSSSSLSSSSLAAAAASPRRGPIEMEPLVSGPEVVDNQEK